jgi:hypothetical protein
MDAHLTPEQIEAHDLVEKVLRWSDMLAPLLADHLTALRMDTDGEQETVDAMATLATSWRDDVLALRALSNRPHDHPHP